MQMLGCLLLCFLHSLGTTGRARFLPKTHEVLVVGALPVELNNGPIFFFSVLPASVVQRIGWPACDVLRDRIQAPYSLLGSRSGDFAQGHALSISVGTAVSGLN